MPETDVKEKPVENVTGKVIVSILIVVICGFPLWCAIGAHILLGPEGFWQKLVFYGLCLFIGGTTQVFLGVWALGLLALVWFDPKKKSSEEKRDESN